MNTIKIPTYIINLERALERRKRMKELLSSFSVLDAFFVNAVDGQTLSNEEIVKLFNWNEFCRAYGRTPRLGEIGCTLSHRRVCDILLKSSSSYALILEDDVILKPEMEKLRSFIDEFMSEPLPRILLLTPRFSYWPPVVKSCSFYKIHKVYYATSTGAYFINKEAAKLICSAPLPHIFADDWIYYKSIGISIYGLRPSLILFSELASESTISQIKAESISMKTRRSFAEKFLFKSITSYGTMILHKALKVLGFYFK